ncbi:MAG: hypothetical protein ACE5QV_02765 [Fidelibacterota bacterium]
MISLIKKRLAALVIRSRQRKVFKKFVSSDGGTKKKKSIVSFNLPFRHLDEVDEKRVLIYLPAQLEEFRVARYVIKSLYDSISSLNMTFIVDGSMRDHVDSEMSDWNFLFIEDKDVKILNLPDSALRRRVREENFSIFMDLNPLFVPLAAALCVESGAGLKVGFSHKAVSGIYNIEFKRNSKLFLEELYREIFKITIL